MYAAMHKFCACYWNEWSTQYPWRKFFHCYLISQCKTNNERWSMQIPWTPYYLSLYVLIIIFTFMEIKTGSKFFRSQRTALTDTTNWLSGVRNRITLSIWCPGQALDPDPGKNGDQFYYRNRAYCHRIIQHLKILRILLPSSVQFQLVSSVQLSLALTLIITPIAPPPGKVICCSVCSWGMAGPS